MAWHAYHTVWALLIFGWICNYIVRMAFSPLLEPVMAEFGLSHAEGGLLFSVFFYGYVAMQVPAGLLGDRFGRKRVLVLGILNTVAFSSSLVAPVVTGWIKDWSGSFAGGCYLVALVGIGAVPVALLVGSPRGEPHVTARF
jgi:MFS family permease